MLTDFPNFFSLSYSPWNLQRNPRPVSRHTLLLLLLWMQSNGDQRKNAKQSINQSINPFISSHTTDIHNLQNQSNENIKNDYKYLNIYDCQKFRNIHDIYRYKSLQSRMFNCSFYDNRDARIDSSWQNSHIIHTSSKTVHRNNTYITCFWKHMQLEKQTKEDPYRMYTIHD